LRRNTVVFNYGKQKHIASYRINDGVRVTGNLNNDSNSMVSVTPWNWEQYIDETKRFQLDYFARRASIENWYPLDKETNPDISDLYY
jgi:hypothetical protein